MTINLGGYGGELSSLVFCLHKRRESIHVSLFTWLSTGKDELNLRYNFFFKLM